MSSITKTLGSFISGQPGMPPLPGDLGLPDKSNTNFMSHAKGENGSYDQSSWSKGVYKPQYDEQRAKAETYNKAFADLLSNQAQLSSGEKKQVYDIYSDKFVGAGLMQKPLTDFSGVATGASVGTQAPATKTASAGAPAASAAIAAGPVKNVGSLGANAGGGARRGRVATLLTGLGGAIERFGD